MLTILLAAIIAISVSFTTSLLEAALYSVPMSRVRRFAEEGRRGGKLLLSVRQNIDQSISAILIFNTLANTIGGTILGSLISRAFGAESNLVLVGGALFAIGVLICGEIIPKTLGVVFADRVALFGSYVIRGLTILLYPFVWLSQYVTVRIRQAGAEQKTVTEEDILSYSKVALEEGTILPIEAKLIANALGLNEKTAHDLMTPRTVVYTLPSELPLSMVTAHSEHWKHSRLPLSRNNDPDRIVGIVFRREIFDALLTTEDEDLPKHKLSEFSHDVEFIPETLPGHQILSRFLAGRIHMFIVTNEHGGMEGVITLEDVLESLLGEEIVDQHDQHEDMQEYAKKLAEKRRQFIQRRG